MRLELIATPRFQRAPDPVWASGAIVSRDARGPSGRRDREHRGAKTVGDRTSYSEYPGSVIPDGGCDGRCVLQQLSGPFFRLAAAYL